MNQVELKALAKINLGLDVLGRRENGYHDVRMIMQSIYLYDEVKIEKKDTPGIEVVTNLKYLPVCGKIPLILFKQMQRTPAPAERKCI